jgi:tetratricopeptide (TPR) repeat protein
MDAEQLYHEALRKSDQNDFAGASLDFHAVVQLQQLPWALDAIDGILEAQRFQQVQFIRELKSKYPDSFPVWLAYAAYFESRRQYPHAVNTYGEMLELFGEDFTYALRIHERRLVTACRLAHSDPQRVLIEEDLRHLWQMGEQHQQPKKARGVYILRVCEALNKATDARVLAQLADDKLFPASVRELFKLKSQELSLLGKVMSSLKPASELEG